MSRPKVKTPPVPAPTPIPEVAPETEDWAYRKAKKGSGFEKTLLAGAVRPKMAPQTYLGVGKYA